MNLFTLQSVYLIGIKGAGMTALAELLMRHGVAVTGSDTTEVFYTDTVLRQLRIPVLMPFDPANIPDAIDVFIYSTAWTEANNSEMLAARATGKPMLSYPEALGLLTQTKLTLAVCGTHGKTTTSALLAECLRNAELDPSAIVGSAIANWGGGALAGKGSYLVLEADEYQDKLRYYQPFGALITSVDWDHPDFFSNPMEYEAVFERFVARLPRHGVLIANGDEARVRVIASRSVAPVITYGSLPDNMVRVVDRAVIDPESPAGKKGERQQFWIEYGAERLGPFSLKLSGRHNAENAAAVIALFLHLKLPQHMLVESLSHFTGTKRRFELVGLDSHGALIFDDYAHHPDEIRVTIAAFRELYPKRRLKLVFHPHTFTRTKALFEAFAESLSLADQVLLIDIYGSARELQGGVSSEDLMKRINRVYSEKASYHPDRALLVKDLSQTLTAQDILVTMGAGDVWQIAEELVAVTHQA